MRIDSHHSYSQRYPLDHLGSILARNRFEGSVLVTAEAVSTPDFVRGLVLPFDPRRLDEYAREPKFRGVSCSFADGVPDGLGELERRGIPLDVTDGLTAIPQIAGCFPALRMVIDRLGDEGDLERAAACGHVWCKLSGVHRFPRPLVRRAMALFGPERLMFGSDWPAGLPDVTWKGSLAAFTQAIGAQPIEVRETLLGGAAEAFYGL